MKYSKIFRSLAIAVVLALLVMTLPATPALAESLRVSPSSGAIDDEVTVTGSGYDPGDRVYIYFSSEEADEGDDVDDLDAYEGVKSTTAGDTGDADEGDIDVDFDVPDELTDGSKDEDVHGGDYFVYTTYRSEGEIVAVDEFTVIGIEEIDPTEGPVGTEVEIKGAGFNDDDDIDVEYDGDSIDIESGDDQTDRHGAFELTIIIPESTEGEHTILVDVDKDEVEATFTVEPEMTISATSGAIGDSVTATGTGFGGRSDVAITFGGVEVATGETDTNGSFSIDFAVPELGAGSYDVKAEDDDNNSGTDRFTITTNVSISPVTSTASPGHVGMDVTISGDGFRPNHEITITYASTPSVFTTTSESDGSFSYTFKIPASEAGEHTITATDGANSLEVPFVMESTAPPIPQPLQPEMNIKAEQPVHFEWGSVTDPSGVTYTLQIATNKNFTPVLLKKEGLTSPEYPMTEDEQLESTSEEEPYYWRVRAIDGASNVSNWTGAGAFYVGFIFKMPPWAIYVLIGLGVLLLGILGFWLGRRSAYY